MDLCVLSTNEKPSILFRVESLANASLQPGGDLRARRTIHGGSPTWHDFDNHLSWTKIPTGLLSFSSSWRQTMRRWKKFEEKGQKDIIVIAVWAEDLTGVYSAEKVASMLGYPDTLSDGRKRVHNHRDEYLVEGGIAADEYRILAMFKGGGPERVVDFVWPFYKASTTIPDGFLLGKRPHNALRDIEDEIYSRTGVRDDRKRDELVKRIVGCPQIFSAFLYFNIQYLDYRGQSRLS